MRFLHRVAPLVLLALAAVAVAATPAPAPRTARHAVLEGVTVTVGDTLTPYYSVQTDSVLAVAPGVAIAKRCGLSKVFLRLLLHGQRVTNDTVLVNVTGCAAPTPPVAVLPDTTPATLAMYTVAGDTLTPLDTAHVTAPATLCVVVVVRTASGRALTGRPVALASSDTLVARVDTGSSSCPDTTVSPTAYVLGG